MWFGEGYDDSSEAAPVAFFKVWHPGLGFRVWGLKALMAIKIGERDSGLVAEHDNSSEAAPVAFFKVWHPGLGFRDSEGSGQIL